MEQAETPAKSKHGGYRPGGGRPKGSKTKNKTAARGAVSQAVVAGALALASTGLAMKGDAPAVAPEGISPKDLLLTTMRMAWESAHLKAAEARELDALAAAATDSETMESFRRTANELRMEAGRHVGIAQQAAKDVAPYEHAKLSNVDATVSGGVVVEIKQYALPVAAPKEKA
jgi:hypothetical protein